MDPLPPIAVQIASQELSGASHQFLMGQDYQTQYIQNLSTNDGQSHSQLSLVYGSREEDLVELVNLLNSWNLGEYFNFFQSKYKQNRRSFNFHSLFHFIFRIISHNSFSHIKSNNYCYI